MFKVRWNRSALDDLTRLWMQASSELRQAITVASHEIDQRLQRDADNQGESRPKGRRILLVSPLVVIYRIEAAASRVRVLQVWQYPRRG